MKTDTSYKPLFDFNMLFDTDFGIMSFISAEFNDASIFSVFNHQWINEHRSIRSMIKALYERKDRNPLIQCTLSNDIKEIDELYDSFIRDEEYYIKVLQRSMVTEIFNLLERSILIGDVQPYIVYQYDVEYQHMKNFDVCKKIPDSNFICLKDIIINPRKYGKEFTMYYCKHNTGILLDALASIYDYAKTYYIADYPFNNYDYKPGTIDISSEAMQIISYINRCNVRSIDIYNRIKLENKEVDQKKW